MKFTQYLRPHGQRKEAEIDRPEAIEKMAAALVEAGYHFDIEVLTDDRTVSMTCEREEEVAAMELVLNGPLVPAAVDRLVCAAWESAQAMGDFEP